MSICLYWIFKVWGLDWLGIAWEKFQGLMAKIGVLHLILSELLKLSVSSFVKWIDHESRDCEDLVLVLCDVLCLQVFYMQGVWSLSHLILVTTGEGASWVRWLSQGHGVWVSFRIQNPDRLTSRTAFLKGFAMLSLVAASEETRKAWQLRPETRRRPQG